jgi:hypothetical protein
MCAGCTGARLRISKRGRAVTKLGFRDSERPMNIFEFQPSPVACVSESERMALRALDEMERLALTQVAAARERKREILLKHGIPIARRTAAKILVMPGVASTEV